MQHPSECKAAKNTARLAALCLPKAQIWIGETGENFENLQDIICHNERQHNYLTAVLYPNPSSVDFLDFKKIHSKKITSAPVQFIFLDGTWKKAYKMWQLNNWLQQYPSIHITQTTSQYHIRKAPKPGCLATIEAIRYCLEAAEGINASPLEACFLAMQQHFVAHTIKNVR